MPSLYLNLHISLDEAGIVHTECSNLSARYLSNRCTQRPVTPVENLLNTLVGFDKGTLKVLQGMRVSPLRSIPKKVQDLWTESTTTWPRLFPAEKCWTKTPPSSVDLVLATLNKLAESSNENKTFTTYRRGEPDSKADPRTAIAQLYEPSTSAPVSLIGLNIPELPDDLLKCPEALSKHVEPYDESGHQLFLTPRFSQTDLHIDSADGLSVPLGQCTKLWLAFPPTPKNLAHMYTQQGRKAKLSCIGSSLEGGLIFQTTAKEAVYLPVGTIHAVLTTTGGFLNALDFTTPESSKTYAPLSAAGIDRADESFRRDCFRHFLKSVELGLDNQRESMAVKAWVDADEQIKEYGAGDGGWRRSAMVIWDDYLERRKVRSISCPCGRGLGELFPTHFRAEHLWKTGGKRSGIGRSMKVSAPRKHTEALEPKVPPFGMVLRSRAGKEKRRLQEDVVGIDRQRPAKKSKR
ncbi:uncharacterized protein BP5553_00223 [Venustampulla echinocandica]|uniref:JmjC domain-containing protein n=1 Tax=Venustampulla echinocandica TaxID=2656787 RepID=A0A370TXH7_9HELO|nr:uncharacterized protein BP5553_00223 [Venustampulla echinocandica]RDL40244.1 hypothetical protein BP5553_00223 [Venustampulla echinocandica]